jgi:hypothetical protein
MNMNNAEARIVLTCLLGVVTCTLLVLIFTVELPTNNKDMAYLVTGNFMGAFFLSVTYWFGTTKGSADKQDELNRRNKP